MRRAVTNNDDFSIAEKQILNDFVYWDNPKKDKFVYQMVSCCFDYCMLTVKKEIGTYKSIFNNRIFYLDTNIVFRLIGINKENRKKIIIAFIKKCQEVGITLKVTNFTIQEMENVIDRNVDKIRRILEYQKPIEPSLMNFYTTYDILNQDFYETYWQWCSKGNQYNDYSAFGKDLKRSAYFCLKEYNISISNNQTQKEINKEFNELVQSLIIYKQSISKNANVNSAQIDVDNYLLIRNQNECVQNGDLFTIKNYLISADHAFGNWARDLVPGSIPIVVLPSVWYSIILQYAGRSNNEDDYAAFTRFLNFSFSGVMINQTEKDDNKFAILKKVLGLREPENIKNNILFEISEKLKSENSEIDNYDDIDSIVDEEYQSVAEKMVEEARKEEREIVKAEREEEREKYSRSINELTAKHQNDVNKLIDENARDKEEMQKIQKSVQNNYYDEETEIRTCKTIKLYKTVTFVMILGLLAIFFIGCIWIKSKSIITEKDKIVYDYAKWTLGIANTLVGFFVIKNKFHNFNKEEIRKELSQKIREEHKNIDKLKN